MNGYATPFPSNRIVVYAHPATDQEGLRNYSDWNELVVTHELTHIFHLDRTRGVWRLGQDLLGRNPLLFPNNYAPSWLTEGLAVYYESRLTGTGRLESGEHFMAARAAAMAREVPRLSELARGTSRYPGGEVVYIYGSLIFDYLSRNTDPGKIREFVERESAYPVPFSINHAAKKAFGISFETAWRRWRDSLYNHLTLEPDPPGWRDLTAGGRSAFFPRWTSDSSVWYAGAKGREVPALYQVDLFGHERNLGRRNGLAPNLRAADGSILFTQEDLVSAYEERTDLWQQIGRAQVQLTHGARLHSPDLSAGGSIVAIQNTAASTVLVRVSADGNRIVPITRGTLDTQWADPRWSPDGSRMAVVRIKRGESTILVLDSTGRVLDSLGASNSINASPAWSADGHYIFFSSERSGSSQLYAAGLDRHPIEVRRLTNVATGIFDPDVSPGGRVLAARLYRADGYHIGVMPIPAFESLPIAEPARVSPRSDCSTCVIGTRPPVRDSAGLAAVERSYSAFQSLLPRYWIPVFQSSGDNGDAYGGETSGTDVIGRHAYDLTVMHNTTHGDNSAWLYYRYSGLGMPLIVAAASQDYSWRRIFTGSFPTLTPFGFLSERSRISSVQAVFVRPRYRTYAALSGGVQLEEKRYATNPDTLRRGLNAFYQQTYTFPALVVAGEFANARSPALSISPEDGIDLSGTAVERWRSGTMGGASASLVTALSAFKSLDLPGFAHHALAVRAAGGVEGNQSSGRFSSGGLSGTSISLFTNNVGGQRRTFGVRGYPVGSEEGIRAVATSAEYRVPLLAPSRGFRFFPLFIDKISADVFGDAGKAWCPESAAPQAGLCTSSDIANPWMYSTGAELNLDTGIRLDFPARLRAGVAFPEGHRLQLQAPRSTVYVTFGSAF